ncbi:hypothetical protein [Nitratireductor indicus]|nr:hypothetical protein [Nitratireductor indicus]MDS1136527.1 hypothetical protein [Nitratireductor indicus]SFQ46462.1 hypothetical protein SAMN05216176_10453 [Nitratireductor indicus]
MSEDDEKREPEKDTAFSGGTKGFVIGALGAAIVILIVMALRGT